MNRKTEDEVLGTEVFSSSQSNQNENDDDDNGNNCPQGNCQNHQPFSIPVRYLCSSNIRHHVGTSLLENTHVAIYAFDPFTEQRLYGDTTLSRMSYQWELLMNEKRFEVDLNRLPQVAGQKVRMAICIGSIPECSTHVPNRDFNETHSPGRAYPTFRENPEMNFNGGVWDHDRSRNDGPDHVLYGSLNVNGQCDYNVSPLVIDFKGNRRVQLTAPLDGVLFDIDNDQEREQISWVSHEDMAFVALDLNQSGRIENGGELFGDATRLPDGKSDNGFDALGKYDKVQFGGNGDGLIDYRDSIYSSLLLWFDRNSDGVSEDGELEPLRDRVASIPVRGYQNIEQEDRFHNKTKQRDAVKLVNGDPKLIFDIYFRVLYKESQRPL